MPNFREFEFEKVRIEDVPPKLSGSGFWKRPTTTAFLEKLTDLKDDEALRVTFLDRPSILTAHQVLRHRIERSIKLGLLSGEYVITGRRNQDGNHYLFLYRKQ